MILGIAVAELAGVSIKASEGLLTGFVKFMALSGEGFDSVSGLDLMSGQ